MAELDFSELQQLAAEILGVDAEQVQLDKSFARDLAADSLDLVELIAAIEDKYDVELSDEELERMKNVGDLWGFLNAERASAECPVSGVRPKSCWRRPEGCRSGRGGQGRGGTRRSAP